MSDILSLLLLIQRFALRAAETAALIQKMRDEGRETLTDEEKAQLRTDDDKARAELVAAIDHAESTED